MGRSKNACLGILTCAGAGGGGGDVAADPTNTAADANECHCEEGKVLSDKSRWSFRRRSTRHKVLRNNESAEVGTVTNKENPNADLINDSNNSIYSPKYSSATDKTVEQEKPKENNIVLRETDEKPRENDVVITESVKETHDESKANKEIVKETHDESKENKEIVKETHDESKENKEIVKETHDESKENKEIVKETHDESKENKESVKETHDESKENKESVKETHDESKENKYSVKETHDELKENKESVKEIHDESKENIVVEEKEVQPKDVAVKVVEMNLEQDNLPATENAANIPEKNENLEQAAVVIQSGFRGYMARKDTMVLKKVVKIQAVARGFLVRSQAVGTLRCLLAIMKMQVVVRFHQTPKKSDIITQGTGGGFSLVNRTCMSNDNLLLNRFASKILDTMPKTKVIHIKCDPYKPDTTWQWLERWTYTIPTSSGSQLPDQNEIIESKTGKIESNAEDSHADCSLPSDAPNSDSNFKSHDQIKKPEDDFGNAAIPEEELNMNLTENGVHACELENENSNVFPKHEIEHENDQSCENHGSDDLTETKLEESDVQKGGNKKAINPNFVAAQMKFQELSTNSNLSVGRSISDSKSFTFQADDASSKNDNNIKNHEAYNITTGGAMIKAVSECGTEISISSTLDSPDRSEIEGSEIVLEIRALENKIYQNHTDSVTTKTQIQAETKNPDLEFQHEPTKEPKETITDSINNATKSVEMERLLRSPEGTPVSHTTTTVTDVHGTPSSQSSVNTKTTKRGRKKKPHGLSTKRSLNSPISDSSNNNNGVIKRHGSIGHDGDTESRISNSSLPSYMQVTESARAKLHPSVSPKLSPDVSETIGNGKKRHSLPITSSKDSSPRMQRSQSHQAQANAKGNGTRSHGSSDRGWQI